MQVTSLHRGQGSQPATHYQVTVARQVQCFKLDGASDTQTCPAFAANGTCKHVLFVLHLVLGVPRGNLMLCNACLRPAELSFLLEQPVNVQVDGTIPGPAPGK